MKVNKLFSKQQFGFISERSTVLQLIKVLDDWTEALDKGRCVDVIYCNFMKAFDKVPHGRLIHKMKSFGIGGQFSVKHNRGFVCRECVLHGDL